MTQSGSTEPEVLYDVDGHVATVTLNRPHRRNAISVPMLVQLGKMSYCLYLVHMPIIAWLPPETKGNVLVAFGLSGLAAVALYHFCERPLLASPRVVPKAVRMQIDMEPGARASMYVVETPAVIACFECPVPGDLIVPARDELVLPIRFHARCDRLPRTKVDVFNQRDFGRGVDQGRRGC